MKKIKLTQDQFALVDDEDFVELNKFKWCVLYAPSTKSFYAVRTVMKNKQIKQIRMHRMHREIMNPPDGYVVDHINHDTLDNRRCNLRVCTSSQNAMNARVPKNSTSGVTGVGWNKDKTKWVARIAIDGCRVLLGYFSNKQDAINARKEAEEKYYGEYSFGGVSK